VIDVLIAGGGPAGATAAHLLASWGWSVVVVNRAPGARPGLAESLPPSTRKLLAFLGQLDAVEAARFQPNLGNIARWAGQAHVTHADSSGFHVSRAAFDPVLRQVARQSGAQMIEGVVQHIDLIDPIRVDYVTSRGRKEMCRVRRLLDCSGRAGVIARHGLRREKPGYRTLAITQEWECHRDAADERTHTFVESYGDGWAWSVPLSATRRQCTVMIDPARFGHQTDVPSGQSGDWWVGRTSIGAVYERELAKAPELTTRLVRGRPVSHAWACNASPYHAPRAAEAAALLVGDAASFIDPLSSAGVKKALLSAWRAAVVTNTCLTRPDMTSPATDFHVRRESEVYEECRRLSRQFFAEAAATYDDRFWSARAESTAGRAPQDHAHRAEELVRDPRVQAAFDRLRRTPLVRLRPAPALRIEPVADDRGT